MSDPAPRDGRSFLALLQNERFLGVRELRCFRAKPPRPAKENYGKKLQFRMVQISGGRAAKRGVARLLADYEDA